MGTNDIIGLEFLNKNKIKDCPCDMSKNFTFISYAHDEKDINIVRTVFKKLYDMGWNIWIDTANIPHDENDWKKAAQNALVKVGTCKNALFFRSEESLIREPIWKELDIIKHKNHIKRIITIDVFHDNNSASDYRGNLINTDAGKFEICDKICEIVSENNSAIRLRAEADNDINKLVAEIAKELKNDNVYRRSETENNKKTRSIKASNELKELLLSDECKDINLKKLINENKLQIRISDSISYKDSYLKYDTWLFSFDKKAEENAYKWDFFILKKGESREDEKLECFDATNSSKSVFIQNSIRKAHLTDFQKVSLDELLKGEWTKCFV